ncbi:MAG: SIMPL domain-containing protein [Muribaculaceae bacterium]
MEKNKQVIAAALIAVGIAILGLCIRSAFGSMSDSQRVVTVKGLAEREVKADKVIWPIVFKELGDNLPALYATVAEKNKIVEKMLTDSGITADEITTSVQVNDIQADAYNAERSVYRYRMLSIVTVNTTKVETVLQLLKRQSELIEQGVAVTVGDYSTPSIQFDFTGLNDIKPDMIKEATQNARAAAEQFASDSESNLGKIKTAYQGQFTIDDRDQTTPYIKNVRVVTTIQYMLED